MSTHDRRRFVSQAIWYFLRQDYSPRELIILDSGADPVADLVPCDPTIRYVRLTQPMSTVDKRKLACDLSTGELIAHWDDDAWYSPYRLAAQAAQFQNAEVEASALRNLLHYQPLTGRLWRHAAPSGAPPRLPGAGLAYRRSFWKEHRFGEGAGGEMAAFTAMVPTGRLAVQDGSALAAILLHGGSTGPVNSADPRWQSRPFDELAQLLGLDLGFYAGLRANGQRPAARLAFAPVTLAASFMVYDGYGSMAEYLALGLARAGADVHIAPFRIDPTALSPKFHELWRRSRPDAEGIVLCHAWWGENLARFGSARDLFMKTVWETNQLPSDWPARLNRATAVIVPSHFAARVFRESGVRAPIEVVHEGIDPEVYPYQEPQERAGFTTLMVGVLAPRKNFRQAVAAWKLAFEGDPDARMIIKGRFQLEKYVPDDPRISVVDSNESTRGILHWYQQADALLALGNEGFGLPLIEGMGTGLPVIALDSEAQGDVCAEAAGMVLPVRPATWEQVNHQPIGPCGLRAIPDVEDAARRLRWVSEHRDEAREMGRRASAWAHAKRNVWDMGEETLAVIERYARTSRPLRRSYAVWAPESDGRPDLGYYNRDLIGSLNLARRYETPPTKWRSQSLHIQYAPGMFDDIALTREIQAAHRNGIVVALTEHVAPDRAGAWEQHADALITLNEAAASRLRERWPGKRVELIPPGCPPWRAPTRNGKGRTVAIFGAPGADRYAELSEALVALPAANLLMFDSAPAVERDQQVLIEAVLGLPVRFAPLPSSSEDLSRQLNEEADVTVFWGHRPGAPAMSYIARIAIASGAPVVTSRTPEYADLSGGAFQPDNLTRGLQEIFTSRTRRAELADAAMTFCEEASWPRVAEIHLALWRSLSS